MALQDLLNAHRKSDIVEVTQEKVEQDLVLLRAQVAYWRIYPDRFIDYLCSLNPDNTFHFYYNQRIFLRCSMRYKTSYCVFPRGYSKSFLSVLSLVLKCILYPGSKIFVVSDVKSQSASILTTKLGELCKLIPALEREIIWENRRGGAGGKTISTKDTVILQFKNGSTLQNIAAADSVRGSRFQSGLTNLAQDKFFELLGTLNIIFTTIFNSKRWMF